MEKWLKLFFVEVRGFRLSVVSAFGGFLIGWSPATSGRPPVRNIIILIIRYKMGINSWFGQIIAIKPMIQLDLTQSNWNWFIYSHSFWYASSRLLPGHWRTAHSGSTGTTNHATALQVGYQKCQIVRLYLQASRELLLPFFFFRKFVPFVSYHATCTSIRVRRRSSISQT